MFKTLIFLLLTVYSVGCQSSAMFEKQNLVLNDLHSRLNTTRLQEIHYPQSTQDLVKIIRLANQKNQAISISGARHAMGGQQFGEGTIHISMKEMNDVLSLDKKRGIVRVEAGIGWPKLIEYLIDAQKETPPGWGIIQKQTGADGLTIGGALSANAHGRGLKFKPIIHDVESFTLVDAQGNVLNVNREENSELFRLTIGGYGLFGVIATVDLRLQPRYKLQRIVETVRAPDLYKEARQRIEQGSLYGDFQYKTDAAAEDFMQVGVLSSYKPVPLETAIPNNQKSLDPQQWYELIRLAHVDKSKAFEIYARHYLTTNGQIYWSDLHQSGYYADDYVEYLEKVLPDLPKGSLMITEVYVLRERINDFIDRIVEDVRQNQVNVIYGTMRLIEKDDESFLAWAKQDYACVIFNLRVEHNEKGIKKAQEDFRRIIDRALELDGSYYLTYHRWARKDQVLKAYPQFVEFLKLKQKYDPQERFQSEWYRHYKKMFAEEL